ncbi:MAG: queuosine precursor transporter [Parachlamydiaceae bacterium]|nr:queuosine precursor transporter [Parachlamydiaceae bacterium]
MEKKSMGILYQIICAAFCVIVVISNIISAKMVQVPFMDGFIIPAGLITYPLTFLLSDFVTEIYDAKKAKLMVYIALGMNLLGFAIIQVTLLLPAATESEQMAFQAIMGLSGLRIFSSLISYLVAQIADIQIYAWIKKWTGPRFLWLRNNASTCISQIIDTVMIDIIYLYWGLGMEMKHVWPIMLFSFTYKIFFSVANTPFFYLLIYLAECDWQMPKWIKREPTEIVT